MTTYYAHAAGQEDRKRSQLTDGQDASARRRDDLTLKLFAFLWAAFTFFHQSKWTWWTRTPIESLQTAAAIFVIFRPSSLSAFLALVTLQLADLLYTLPNISNHSIFALFVNLTILGAALTLGVRRRRGPMDKGALLRLFAPAVRIEVLILYFYVVLHKLNTGFLSTASSCAVDHTFHLSGLAARLLGVGIFPDGAFARIFVIAATLVIEAAIPILLVFKRTRIAGVATGIAFHYLLGANIYHDFSGMIFALYLLFLPTNFAERAYEWWQPRWAQLRAAMPARLRSGAVPSGLWGSALVVAILLATGNQWSVLHPIFFVIWMVYGFLLALLLVAVVAHNRKQFQYEGGTFRASALMLVVPFMVACNGFVPYLGLKTGHSFAMFSNLRTEGGRTNHLFLPVSLQVFDFQKDLVTIESSTIYELQGIAQRRTAVPYFVVREHVSTQARRGKMNIRVVYTRNGVQRAVNNAESDPELSASHPWLWRKLLLFREVDLGPQQMCRH